MHLGTADRTEELLRDEAILVGPGHELRARCFSGTQILTLTFTAIQARLVGRQGSYHLASNETVQPDSMTVWGTDLTGKLKPRLAQLTTANVDLIRGEYWREPTGYARACARLGMLLAELMTAQAPRTGGPEDVTSEVSLERQLLRKLAQLGLPVPNVTEVARHTGWSREGLSRAFKSETGMALSEWLAERRWSSVLPLLAQPTARTGVIRHTAFLAGYSSLSAFQRAFRKRYGCSPGKWRRRLLILE